jgi:DNA-binding transcriptional MerR regulator
MQTVSKLARSHGVSRTTLLYYEKQGLLEPSQRGANGYRYYNEDDEEKLRRILSYRSFGLPVPEIRKLLVSADSHSAIAQSHFLNLEKEIQSLRRQQYAVIHLLRLQSEDHKKKLNRKTWTELMRSAGLDDTDMLEWHRQFESMEPQDHEEFLKLLGFSLSERKNIRRQSRARTAQINR